MAWRQEQAEKTKMEQSFHIIEERREEHQRMHRESMRLRHESGYVTVGRRRGPKQKESVEIHEGPQFSLVLKGLY